MLLPRHEFARLIRPPRVRLCSPSRPEAASASAETCLAEPRSSSPFSADSFLCSFARRYLHQPSRNIRHKRHARLQSQRPLADGDSPLDKKNKGHKARPEGTPRPERNKACPRLLRASTTTTAGRAIKALYKSSAAERAANRDCPDKSDHQAQQVYIREDRRPYFPADHGGFERRLRGERCGFQATGIYEEATPH